MPSRRSAKLRSQVFRKTGGRCSYCGRELKESSFHIDHATPLDHHSVDTPAAFARLQHVDNLLPSCATCNRWKSNRSVQEFREYISKLRTLLLAQSAKARFLQHFGLLHLSDTDPVFFIDHDPF